MAFTPRGIQKPDGSTPAQLKDITGALADTTNTALDTLEATLKAYMGARFQRVTVTVATVAGTTVTQTVTFPANFVSNPTISVTPNAMHPEWLRVSRNGNPTLNTVPIAVYREAGTGSGNVGIDVIGVAS